MLYKINLDTCYDYNEMMCSHPVKVYEDGKVKELLMDAVEIIELVVRKNMYVKDDLLIHFRDYFSFCEDDVRRKIEGVYKEKLIK